MSALDTKILVATIREHARLKAEVFAWMSAEGTAGRLRQNWHAPMWHDYERSARVLEAHGDAVSPLLAEVDRLRAALATICDAHDAATNLTLSVRLHNALRTGRAALGDAT